MDTKYDERNESEGDLREEIRKKRKDRKNKKKLKWDRMVGGIRKRERNRESCTAVCEG